MTVTDKQVRVALDQIAILEDPRKLRALMKNARTRAAPEVEAAARRRLSLVLAQDRPDAAEPDSVEEALWQAIHAMEEVRSEDAGKTIRLSYLRRDVDKLGVVTAVDKLVSKPGASERYGDLMARGLPELTAEAVVLRFADAFSETAVTQARERVETGTDTSSA
jgi:hypothetical protein